MAERTGSDRGRPRHEESVSDEGGNRRANPLWAHAPLVMRRFPGLFAALSLGTLLLALAGAAYPLFLSGTASELVQAQVSEPLVTRWGMGVAYRRDVIPVREPSGAPLHDRLREAFTRRTSAEPLLGDVVRSALGPEITISSGDRGRRTRTVRVMGRDQGIDHVRVLEEGPQDGLWISDLTARGIRARPGDTILLEGPGGSVEASVAGVYRALAFEPRGGAWRAWSGHIYPECEMCPPQPPFVLTGYEGAVDLLDRLGIEHGTFGLEAPAVGRRLTLPEARTLAAFANRFHADMAERDTPLYELFRCCGRQGVRFDNLTYATFGTAAPQVVAQVEQRLIPVEGPVQLLLAAGLAVALAVTAAAGAFAARTRRVEARLLEARGIAPAAIGVRSGIEAFVPAALGSAIGLGLAMLLVGGFGPDGPVSRTAIRDATIAAVLTVPLAVLVVTLVATVSFRSQSLRVSRLGGALARFPWEVALLAGGALLYARLRSGGAFVAEAATGIERPSPLLLGFPVLVLAGAGLLGGRLLRSWLRARRGAEGPRSHTAYLALRRLAGAPGLVALLFVGAAVSIGTLGHAQTVSRSLAATVEAKAKIFVGSDMQATIGRDTAAPSSFPLPVTRVTRARGAGSIGASGPSVDILAVDPATLPEAAYWHEAFGDRPLEELAPLLRAPAGSRVPVIVSGTPAPGRFSLVIAQRPIDVRVVERTRAFPGTGSRLPLVVVSLEALTDAYGSDPLRRLANVAHQLWVRGAPQETRRGLAGLDPAPFSTLSAREVMDVPAIAAVIDTFGVLNVLGLAAGFLVAAALLMYLQTRQRDQTVSHALTARMGLAPRAHRRALTLELSLILGAAALVGMGAAFVVSRLTGPLLDPLDTIPPEPLFLPPYGRLVVLVAALAGIAAAGSLLADRRARRADLSEVLRVAE